MGTEQYHEPAADLTQAVRSFARIATSLKEEAEAIGWYQQRISLEQDATARAIMEEAQKEECQHFSMDLEWLMRMLPVWREAALGILFQPGDIVANKTQGEERDNG